MVVSRSDTTLHLCFLISERISLWWIRRASAICAGYWAHNAVLLWMSVNMMAMGDPLSFGASELSRFPLWEAK